MFDAAWEGKQIIEEALDAEGQLTPEELNQLLSVINRSVANIVKLQNKVYKYTHFNLFSKNMYLFDS